MDTAAGIGSVSEQTLYSLFLQRSERAPTQPVILSARGETVTNAVLLRLAERTCAWMRDAGFRPATRVALIMRNGPAHAAITSALASCVACAPLNPDLPEARWEETFAALRIDAVALIGGQSDAAARAARALGLPLIEIRPGSAPAEVGYQLTGAANTAPCDAAWPTLDDTALVLATSGTTSQAKVVPLSHRNLCHSGHNTARALALGPEDRLLGVLPLHHAHGLISGLMATLAGGGSVICMEGFETDRFFDLLVTLQPSWYTAVPAIHQAVLDAAPRHQSAIAGHKLRLVRSASAPLAPERFAALEALFGVPVIETFGMTEATSQIASNPLPPGRQKPGSVGIAAGPEIRIADEKDAPCAAGSVGQILLRGPNITRGYDDPAETRAAFTDAGWFRTGDLGYLDSEGYLFIVGRLKEVINRGGEKLLPQRIEAVLRGHPAVSEAVVFAAPHRRLGEDVAAAIVPKEDQDLTESALRAFALARKDLSDAEIPRRILIVDAIPRNPLGKLQRARLAAHFGISAGGDATGGTNAAPPETETERLLMAIWAEVFTRQKIGIDEDFFHLGGDSLLAVQIALRIGERLGVTVSLRTLFEAPTIRTLGAYLDSPRGRVDQGFALSRPVNPGLQHRASISQAHILDLEAGLGGFSSYTIPLVYLVDGPLDPAIFDKAVRLVLARHESFRCVFKRIAGRWHAIPSASVNRRITCEDWTWAKGDMRAGFLNDTLESEVWEPLDPTTQPPFRLRLLKFAPDAHGIVIVVHHIIMDNWTVKTFIEEVFEHYGDMTEQGSATKPAPAFQFSDFARWQRNWCAGEGAAEQSAYWRDRLSGARSIVAPVGGVEPGSVGFTTARVGVDIGAGTVAALTAAAKQQGGTLFMALLTQLKIFLATRFGARDITITTPTANRARPNTAEMLGLITNNAAIRTVLPQEGGFNQVFQKVRHAVLDAYAHQELPFEVVTEQLAGHDPLAAACLAEIYFSLVDHYEPEIAVEGLSLHRMDHDQEISTPIPINTARMMFMLKRRGDRVHGSFLFKPTRFDRGEAEALIQDFIAMLDAQAILLAQSDALD